MTQRPASQPEILDVLRTTPLGVPTPAEIEAERARLVPWLEEQVRLLPDRRAQVQKQRRQRWAAGTLAALAVAAGAWMVVRSSTPRPPALAPPTPAFATLVSGALESGKLELLPGSRLGLSSQVRASRAAPAVLEASSGYRVELAASSEVVFIEPTARATRLRLLDGEVALSVPKLEPGRVLEIETADAIVRVRGTRFSVRFDGTVDAPRTCVRVSEGLVEVERHGERTFVAAAESLGCAVERATAERPGPSAALQGPKPPKTSLSEENRLLALALAAERAGRTEEARRGYTELQRRFPESRFLPETRAGLERLARPAPGP